MCPWRDFLNTRNSLLSQVHASWDVQQAIVEAGLETSMQVVLFNPKAVHSLFGSNNPPAMGTMPALAAKTPLSSLSARDREERGVLPDPTSNSTFPFLRDFALL
jgi:hypothetical protein